MLILSNICLISLIKLATLFYETKGSGLIRILYSLNYILCRLNHLFQLLLYSMSSKVDKTPNFTLDKLRFKYLKNGVNLLVTEKKRIILSNTYTTRTHRRIRKQIKLF